MLLTRLATHRNVIQNEQELFCNRVLALLYQLLFENFVQHSLNLMEYV